MFIAVNQAYEVLSDDGKRRDYDDELSGRGPQNAQQQYYRHQRSHGHQFYTWDQYGRPRPFHFHQGGYYECVFESWLHQPPLHALLLCGCPCRPDTLFTIDPTVMLVGVMGFMMLIMWCMAPPPPDSKHPGRSNGRGDEGENADDEHDDNDDQDGPNGGGEAANTPVRVCTALMSVCCGGVPWATR